MDKKISLENLIDNRIDNIIEVYWALHSIRLYKIEIGRRTKVKNK